MIAREDKGSSLFSVATKKKKKKKNPESCAYKENSFSS
jgi:hypothetical protein